MDNLSTIHFKTVNAEIQGRFFSREEADELKEAIDRRVVTSPAMRKEAAKTWGTTT